MSIIDFDSILQPIHFTVMKIFIQLPKYKFINLKEEVKLSSKIPNLLKIVNLDNRSNKIICYSKLVTLLNKRI